MIDLLDVTLTVVRQLEACDVPYTVGGSLASSLVGEPRASIDADVVVDMTTAQVDAFAAALGDAFYLDRDALHRAVARRSTVNIIHRPSGIKVDLFVAGSAFDQSQLARRRSVEVRPGDALFVHSAEDILLQKLLWYRKGGEVSDRQWRDARAIALRRRGRLDDGYLTSMAATVGVSDLLSRVLAEPAAN